MSDSSQATRPGEIWIGRGARLSRIIRHQVVRLIPILGCRARQDSSRKFVVLIITFSFEPLGGRLAVAATRVRGRERNMNINGKLISGK